MTQDFVEQGAYLENEQATSERYGELIDWLRRLHFDDRIAGLVIMAIERVPDGTQGSVRSVMPTEGSEAHIETLKEWVKRAEGFYTLVNTTGGRA